jgi:hypothetical protein
MDSESDEAISADSESELWVQWQLDNPDMTVQLW